MKQCISIFTIFFIFGVAFIMNTNIANAKTEYCVMNHEELQLEYRDIETSWGNCGNKETISRDISDELKEILHIYIDACNLNQRLRTKRFKEKLIRLKECSEILGEEKHEN